MAEVFQVSPWYNQACRHRVWSLYCPWYSRYPLPYHLFQALKQALQMLENLYLWAIPQLLFFYQRHLYSPIQVPCRLLWYSDRIPEGSQQNSFCPSGSESLSFQIP